MHSIDARSLVIIWDWRLLK